MEKTIDMRKKLYFILLSILPVLALASCNKEKDDNQPVGYSEAIIGSWQSTERTFAEYKDGEQVMDESHTYTENDCIIAEFKEGGTGTWTIISSEGENSVSSTWSISGELLTLTLQYEDVGDQTTHYTIDDLAGQELVLMLTDKYDYDGSHYEDVTKFSFKKL